MNAKKPIVVREIIMHVGFHADEAFGCWLLKKFGEALFPGIKQAQQTYVSDDPKGQGNEHFDSMNLLPVGCGKGCRFNEHRAGIERIYGECSATLIATYLEINSDPAIKVMLEEILWCDSMSGVSNTQLAEIIKCCHRNMKGVDPQEIYSFAEMAFDAIYAQLTLAQSSLDHTETLKQVFDNYEGKYIDKKASNFVRQILGKSVRLATHHGSVTELSYIANALKNTQQHVDVERCVLFYIDLLYQDQLAIHELAEEFKKIRPVTIKSLVHGKEREIHALVVKSDHPHRQRAARMLDPDILVLQNSKGQVQIFGSKKIYNLTFSSLVRMLRWTDLSPGEKNKVSWGELAKEGKRSSADKWYYMKDCKFVLNGSDTHPGVTPTSIHLQGVIDILKNAFDPLLVGKWKSERGIENLKNFERGSNTDDRQPRVMTRLNNVRVQKVIIQNVEFSRPASEFAWRNETLEESLQNLERAYNNVY